MTDPSDSLDIVMDKSIAATRSSKRKRAIKVAAPNFLYRAGLLFTLRGMLRPG